MRLWLHDRQKEKREDIKEVLRARGYDRVWDMSSSEQKKQYFEGTGVLVLDRVNGVAYVNISERAHADLAQRWADHLGYEVSALPGVPGRTCPPSQHLLLSIPTCLRQPAAACCRERQAQCSPASERSRSSLCGVQHGRESLSDIFCISGAGGGHIQDGGSSGC